MNYEEVFEYILKMFPEAEIAEDNDGQIIIYTGMTTINSDGEVGPIECEGK